MEITGHSTREMFERTLEHPPKVTLFPVRSFHPKNDISRPDPDPSRLLSNRGKGFRRSAGTRMASLL